MIDIKIPEKLNVVDAECSSSEISSLKWLYADADFFKPVSEVGGLTITAMKRHVALERCYWFWSRPVFGGSVIYTSGDSRPDEMHFVLGCNEDGTEHLLLLPLMAGDWRAYLRPEGENGLTLGIHGGAEDSAPQTDSPLMLIAKGPEPISLVSAAIAALSKKLGTFKLAKDKRVPEFVDWFGWCTWNAFYHDVTGEKVKEGLQSFRDGGLEPRFMILDDGWQDVTPEKFLNSFGTNETFPGGLNNTIKSAKEDYGVKIFGVWHALQGYWGGVNPDGPLAKEYKVNSRKGLKPCEMEEEDVAFVDKRDIYRFYQDYYSYLSKAGVDMVKVDSQSGLHEIVGPGYESIMQAYQRGLQGAAHTHFEGNLLHCMSNTHDVAYNMAGSIVWRNSDDFFPDKPESHAQHIIINAHNAVWTSNFCLPDWDMFESGHEVGAYHAAGRAISGGPVYVSDAPGKQNIELIKKLCLSDGRALRSTNAAKAVSARYYHDAAKGEGAQLIANNNGNTVVLGAFNCTRDASAVTDKISAELAGAPAGDYACYMVNADKFQLVSAEEELEINLKHLEAEIYHFVPVDKGVAVIGLLDKYNCSAAVKAAGWEAESYRFTVIDGGKIGIYCQSTPKAITTTSGENIEFTSFENGMVELELPVGKEYTLVLK